MLVRSSRAWGAVTAVLSLSLVLLLVPAARPAAAQTAPTVTSDRLVVRFAPGVDAVAAAAQAGAELVDHLPALGLHTVQAPAGQGAAVAGRLVSSLAATSVEADQPIEVEATPNDPFWSTQWGPIHIGASAAWDVSTGSSDTVVAVLDTGVATGHQDLAGALVAGTDLVNDDDDATDDQGHGTFVAGIIAARGNNAKGVAGLCWACRVMPIKVLDDQGQGVGSDAAAGIIWAVDHGADVINMSFGSPDSSTAMAGAVAYAHAHGVLLVAAAGNDGVTDERYPAAYPGVLSVAGTDVSDRLYPWSNRGSWVALAAPGCNRTTHRDGGYAEMCGTSSAAPVVAGVTALAVSAFPTLGYDVIRDEVRATAETIDADIVDGRVSLDDLFVSLTALVTPEEPEQPEEPEPITAEACPADRVQAQQFADVDYSATHASNISCMVWWGIAGGKDSSHYGPGDNVTRAQMATFIARALTAASYDLPAAPADAFPDDTGNAHEGSINQLAAAGVIGGRADGTYDPAGTVTRAQMATFLVRAYETILGEGLPGAPNAFNDDENDAHEGNIDLAFQLGFTGGIGDGRFGPANSVRRDQMASFIVNVLQKLLEGGFAQLPAS